VPLYIGDNRDEICVTPDQVEVASWEFQMKGLDNERPIRRCFNAKIVETYTYKETHEILFYEEPFTVCINALCKEKMARTTVRKCR
jgi:hypothetical protein